MSRAYLISPLPAPDGTASQLLAASCITARPVCRFKLIASAAVMLARGLLCRLAADTPKPKTSAHNLPQLARLLQRSLVARNGLTPSVGNCLTRAYRNALVQYVRSYATAI